MTNVAEGTVSNAAITKHFDTAMIDKHDNNQDIDLKGTYNVINSKQQTFNTFNEMTAIDQTRNCLHCAQLTATLSNDALTELSFSHTTDESFSLLFGGNHQDSIGNLTADLATNADDLFNMANELNAAPKDISVGHLNICSLRNKIDELRLIQNICRFDILGITETHLNSTDADRDIHIDGLEFLRLDR